MRADPIPGSENPWAQDWDGDVARRWLAEEDAMDRVLGPFGEAALARAGAKAGEWALDVGCGCGATTVALADAVGGQGHVLGIDVSGPLLARARARSATRPQVTLLQADAEDAALDRDLDLVYSRFGLMFFANPRVAFGNLRRALRAGGRLAFVCWRRFEENPWQHLSYMAMKTVNPGAPVPPDDGPSPFAFADPEKLARLLDGAGFVALSIERYDHDVLLGRDLARAVGFSMSVGPTARGLTGADQPTRAKVAERITAALAPSLSDEGVVMRGSAWVVSARVDRD